MITFRFRRPSISLLSSKTILLLLCLFLLVFPKGGFKISGTPITWGYLLLSITLFFSFFRNYFTHQKNRVQAVVLMLPFQTCILLSANQGISHFGFAVSYFLSFFLIPWAFFLFLSESIETMDLDYLFRILRKGILFIAMYGIFLFFYKFITNKFIEIPFLTMNYHDLGELQNKCNNRGMFTKLISTYNNGNIYGVCLLILLPLYSIIETRNWPKFLVKFSLFLSLSRTVWLGLLFSEIMHSLFISKKNPRLLIKFIGFTAIAFIVFLICFQHNPQLFLDKSFGGRVDQFEILNQITIFPNGSLGGVSEIVYLGILSNLGVIGLITYLICVGAPLFLSLSQYRHSTIRKTLYLGVLNYLFISCSDGALLYIPTMAFYWFVSSLTLRKNLDSHFQL